MTSVRRALLTASFVLSACVASAQTIIERHIVAQGSIGQPGRETAFLILVNDEQVPVDVIMKYLTDSGLTVVKPYALAAESRTSVNVGITASELGTANHFAAIAYVSDPDPLADPNDPLAVVVRMVWHRTADGREVDSQPAEVRRSLKR